MRISFITDFAAQEINVNTYLGEQNPVIVPVASTDATFTFSNDMKVEMEGNYPTKLSALSDTTHTVITDFDQLFLYPKKLSTKTLKGGIFFKQAVNTDTVYEFSTLVNTRSPTSYFFLPALAAETILNKVEGKSVSITVINHPMPRTYQQKQFNNTIAGFFASFIFSIALAFKFASIIAFIVKEREDRSKHQQIVSGMRISSYWISNFIFDYALYLVVAVVSVGLCKGLDITSLTTGSAYAATWLLFIFYGLAYVTVTYIFAFIFKDYGNAQAGYFFLTFVAGGMLPILTFLLRFLSTGANPVGRGIAWILRFHPAFAFGEGLINLGSLTAYGTI